MLHLNRNVSKKGFPTFFLKKGTSWHGEVGEKRQSTGQSKNINSWITLQIGTLLLVTDALWSRIFLSFLHGCFLEWRCGKFGLSKLLLQGPSLVHYAGPSEPCWVVYAGRWSRRRSSPVVFSLWFFVNGYCLLFILSTLLLHRTFTNPIHD